MLKYITDTEYKTLLGAKSIPDNFNKLVIEASSYINRQTFGRIDLTNIPEKVKYATCLIIDLINEEENKLNEMDNLKSQNIEGWSETYLTPEEIKADYADKKYSILKEYLWDIIGIDGNPLLYCGVCQMKDRFFKHTVTLFLFNKAQQNFDRFVIKNVYFRHAIATRMTEEGLIRISSGTITIPSEFAQIDDSKAIYTYNKETSKLNFVLNGLLTGKTWTLNGNSYVIDGEVPDMSYNELIKKYHLFRITSVADNRKGGLQHLKIEVDE